MTTAETIGGAAGAYGGGALGGLVGSFLGGPVGALIGRAIGANLGRAAGAVAGGYIASMMEDANDAADKPEEGLSDQDEAKCDKKCQEEKKKKAKAAHDNAEKQYGRNKNDVEAELDRDLRDNGWSKERTRDDNGWRYTSPDKNQQIIINDGYPNAPDPLHGGPYLKRPSTGTRIPLQGNPTLNGS